VKRPAKAIVFLLILPLVLTGCAGMNIGLPSDNAPVLAELVAFEAGLAAGKRYPDRVPEVVAFCDLSISALEQGNAQEKENTIAFLLESVPGLLMQAYPEDQELIGRIVRITRLLKVEYTDGKLTPLPEFSSDLVPAALRGFRDGLKAGAGGA